MAQRRGDERSGEGPPRSAILADRLLPGVLDLLLAKRGYAKQQRGEPEDPDRDDVLQSGTSRSRRHGGFDAQAASRCRQLDLNIAGPLEKLRATLAKPATRRDLERMF